MASLLPRTVREIKIIFCFVCWTRSWKIKTFGGRRMFIIYFHYQHKRWNSVDIARWPLSKPAPRSSHPPPPIVSIRLYVHGRLKITRYSKIVVVPTRGNLPEVTRRRTLSLSTPARAVVILVRAAARVNCTSFIWIVVRVTTVTPSKRISANNVITMEQVQVSTSCRFLVNQSSIMLYSFIYIYIYILYIYTYNLYRKHRKQR